MRPHELVTLALASSSLVVASAPGVVTTVIICGECPSSMTQLEYTPSPTPLPSGWSPNVTISSNGTYTQSTRPSAKPSKPAESTGGAIPQQMQSSMAALLGFFIMGLVML